MSVETLLEVANIQNEMRGVQDRIKYLRDQLFLYLQTFGNEFLLFI